MTATAPPRDWTDIYWPDIAAASPSRWIAVLPLAATEQHGPHLPVGTDVMIAQAYLRACGSCCLTAFRRPFFRCSRSAFPPSTSAIPAP